MTSKILYEVRIIEKSKLNRRYVDSLSKLFSIIKGITTEQCYVYKLHKSLDGALLHSERLNCQIRGRSLIVKTVKIQSITKDFKQRTNIFIDIKSKTSLTPTFPRDRRAGVLKPTKLFRNLTQGRGSGVIPQPRRRLSQGTRLKTLSFAYHSPAIPSRRTQAKPLHSQRTTSNLSLPKASRSKEISQGSRSKSSQHAGLMRTSQSSSLPRGRNTNSMSVGASRNRKR